MDSEECGAKQRGASTSTLWFCVAPLPTIGDDHRHVFVSERRREQLRANIEGDPQGTRGEPPADPGTT